MRSFKMVVREISKIEDLVRIIKGSPIPILVEIIDSRLSKSALSDFFTELSNMFEGRVGFLRINIDVTPDALNVIRISYIPAYIGFDNGNIVDVLESPHPIHLKRFIEKLSRII